MTTNAAPDQQPPRPLTLDEIEKLMEPISRGMVAQALRIIRDTRPHDMLGAAITFEIGKLNHVPDTGRIAQLLLDLHNELNRRK